jgi:aminopeptidase N
LKTTSIEEKQNYYDALASSTDPKLAARTLEISLTDEVPTSRAVFLVSKVARQSERPEIAWQFAKAHMKQLLAKTDALGANSYAPGLFTFFSDAARIAELESYAKANLPPASAKHVAKAVDEIGFRAELKPRLLTQIATWISEASKGH